MKRLAVILAGMTLCATASAAQAQVIGFKVGPTFSNISVKNDTDDTEQKRLTSFGGGGFIRFGLAGLSLQPEVLVITKGSQVEGSGDDDVKLKLDYLEIPILARFTLSQNGTFAPYILVGPSFAFEIGCAAEADLGGTEVSADCDDEDADTFDRKKFDIGAAAAIGFEFAAGPGNILVEGRYTHGFSNINDDDTDDVELRNRSFALFAGYAIALGSRR